MANDYGTFVFKNTIYQDIKQTIPKKEKEFAMYVRKYIDTNNEVLFNKGLNQLYFGTNSRLEDKEIIFRTIGKTDKEITTVIKESGQTDSSWKIFNKPEFWGLVSMIKYFDDNKKEKELEMAILYLSFALYSSLFYKYFKGPVVESVMDYTINNLSNRYDIKKLGSLFKTLHKISMNCHEKYRDTLSDKEFSDRYILEYIMNLRVRINSFVQKIKDQYQKNKASGRHMNYEKDDTSEGSFYESDNLSYQIERMSNKITTRIITTGINAKIAVSSAEMTGVSISSVKDAIEKILEKETQEIKEFIILFLQQYLIVDNHPTQSISSKNYITFANRIYSKSNTNDKGVIRMKEILDKWLSENCEKYVRTERIATKNNFRKSIFMYFVLSIQAVMHNNY